jgi:hypothetical protein
MNYQQEIKLFTGYCGSYCRTCDWHTGKIHRQFAETLKMWETYGGFPNQTGESVDRENLKQGLSILAHSSICSGCKGEFEGEGDRCAIRFCAHKKGIDLCLECQDYGHCPTLRENPGVIRFGCLENLEQIKSSGVNSWIDSQWQEFLTHKL